MTADQPLSPQLIKAARIAACEFYDGRISSADAAARFSRIANSGWHGEPLNALHREFDAAVARLIDAAKSTTTPPWARPRAGA